MGVSIATIIVIRLPSVPVALAQYVIAYINSNTTDASDTRLDKKINIVTVCNTHLDLSFY